MKKITILATHNTIATTVFGPMDVFFLAGRLWNAICGTEQTPYFNVEIVSRDGRPVKCLNQTMLVPQRAIAEVEQTDLIVISSIADIEKTMRYNQEAPAWLRYHYRQGASIASVCTGAFLLAESGLLDGRSATTHWGFVELFRRRYPQVRLIPERLITDEGRLFCAGALSAGMDLSLYLVQKYCGHAIAVQCAKALLHAMGRDSQAPYSMLTFQKQHADEAILAAQAWLEKTFHQVVDMNRVARRHGMSRRTFERRFKKATGDTPLGYLQRARVEAAKKLLESHALTFDEISRRTGYENSGHFREIFKKHTGLLPTEYQKYFRMA